MTAETRWKIGITMNNTLLKVSQGFIATLQYQLVYICIQNSETGTINNKLLTPKTAATYMVWFRMKLPTVFLLSNSSWQDKILNNGFNVFQTILVSHLGDKFCIKDISIAILLTRTVLIWFIVTSQ